MDILIKRVRYRKMDEFVIKAAALGLPPIMLIIMMANAGLAGAAPITLGLATEMLSKYGLEALLIGIYRQRLQNGESKSRLCREIRNLPISGEMKRRLDEKFLC